MFLIGKQKHVLYTLAVVCSLVGAGAMAMRSTGVVFWVAIAIALLAAMLMCGILLDRLSAVLGKEFSWAPLHKGLMVVGSTMGAVIAIEGTLSLLEHMHAGASTTAGKETVSPRSANAVLSWKQHVPEIDRVLSVEAIDRVERRAGVVTLPQEWERREVQLDGGQKAEQWHGAVHVYDSHYFRRTTPFPEKREGVFRVIVVGDSLTYGYGVEERFIYSALLQRALEKQLHIEVLALGNNGAQSEDILRNLQRFVPELRPDLVLYGVVLNDFLPSQKGQYTCRVAPLHVLEKLEDALTARSRLAGLVRDRYQAALRMVGACADFFDDILSDFGNYQERFGRDVAEMNRVVTARGLPPIIAMVLDQFPEYEGRGHRIARTAERLLGQAGMDVIGTEEYYRRLSGLNFSVSPWEGHPNEEGHAIFAAMFLTRVAAHPALKPYRRPPAASPRQ